MPIMFNMTFDEITREVDAEKLTNKTRDILKTKNGQVSHLHKAKIQSLKKEAEILSMDDEKMIVDSLIP